MRVSLLHGEDITKSYKKYRDLVDSCRKKGFDIIEIKDIKEIVGQSLFQEKIVFTLRNSNKIVPKDLVWLKKNASSYNSNLLIFWEKEAPVSMVKSLPKDAKVEKFDYPKTIFRLLDNLYPGNLKICLILLNELLQKESIELVFYLICRQFRDLFWARGNPESIPIPDWRVLKLNKQASKFNVEDLKSAIFDLAQIDIKAKTGEGDLKRMLDLFIIKYIE